MPGLWLKKNPFLSNWLSSANILAGSFRSQAAARTERDADAAVTAAANESIRSWVAALTPSPAKHKAIRKR